jgi:hypothetical protein
LFFLDEFMSFFFAAWDEGWTAAEEMEGVEGGVGGRELGALCWALALAALSLREVGWVVAAAAAADDWLMYEVRMEELRELAAVVRAWVRGAPGAGGARLGVSSEAEEGSLLRFLVLMETLVEVEEEAEERVASDALRVGRGGRPLGDAAREEEGVVLSTGVVDWAVVDWAVVAAALLALLLAAAASLSLCTSLESIALI